jgi:hypothetical protein
MRIFLWSCVDLTLLQEQERLAKKRAGQLHGQRAQAQRMLNDEAPLEIAQFQEAKDVRTRVRSWVSNADPLL